MQSVEPKVMGVLQHLVERAPEVVSRKELIDVVWAGESGGDESLSRAISLLRKALGDDQGQRTYIETVPRKGYRLIAPVGEAGDPAPRLASRVRLWIAVALAALVVALLFAGGIFKRPGETAMPAAGIPQRSIAVLPFVDMSATGDQQYFADGLAEEILNALMRVPELKIAGRTSAFAYQGRNLDLRRIGEELNVSYVLEGSVRKQGEQVRITAQLVRTDDGYHRWSRNFDGEIADIFDLQESIAREITGALELVLDHSEQGRLARQLTANQQAYDAFLQGRAMSRRFGKESKQTAIELLELAVALDENFAEAWAELARAYQLLSIAVPDDALQEKIQAADHATRQALRIDPDHAFAHYTRAFHHAYQLDMAGAFEAARTAYRLAPSNPFLKIRYGYSLALIGHTREGAALMAEGLARDPTDLAGLLNYGAARYVLGDIAEAERLARRSYELGFKPAGIFVALLLADTGRADEALALWRPLRESLAGRFIPAMRDEASWEAAGRAIFSRDQEQRIWLKSLLDDYFERPDAVSNSYRVGMYLWIGEAEAFMRNFVDKPFPVNSSQLYYIWDDQPGSLRIRSSDKFTAFAERIGFVAAWQRYGWPEKCRPDPRINGQAPGFACD